MKSTIIRKHERHLPSRLTHDDGFEELVEDFFRPYSLVPSEMEFFQPTEAFIPRIDVEEWEKEIRVTAELPGMEEKGVKLELEETALMLSGEKKEEREEKTRHDYRMERRYGSFHRVIPLPARVQVSKAVAKFHNGILTVTIPKMEEARKHVEIKVG